MDWPYHFNDLTDTEKQQRRALLDTYGNIAQSSILLPLFVIQCAFAISWLNRRRQTQKEFEVPTSPHLKDSRYRRSKWLKRATIVVRKVQWWLGDDQRLGDVEGTRGQVLFALGWLVWLAWLCFAHTGKGEVNLARCSDQSISN